jgi:glycosyltransferase involved in cell wall biosynthesis
VKILHAETSGWGGGLERIVATLADNAYDRGWEAVVCYWRGTAPQTQRAPCRFLGGGLRLSWIARLARAIRQESPDIVHLHGPTAGSIGALVARLSTNVPIVYTEHSIHGRRPPGVRLLRTLASRVPTHSVAVSPAAMTSLVRDLRLSRRRVTLIPNGVAAGSRLPRCRAGLHLIYVANFWPHKGHEFLVRVVSAIAARRTVCLTLVGKGPEQQRIEDLISDLSLTNSIEILGYREDPWSTLKCADIYVHPSQREGLSLALAEAMARQLPVVAAGEIGATDMGADGTSGMRRAFGDTQGWVDAIEKLMEDRALRVRQGKVGQATAQAEFSLEKFLAGYSQMYERLVREWSR